MRRIAVFTSVRKQLIVITQAYARSEAEGDAYTFKVSPDLVVEVGLTHESKEKYLSYRDKGAVEFWQLNIRRRCAETDNHGNLPGFTGTARTA